MDITLNNVLSLFDKSGKNDTDLEKEIGIPRSTIYDWRNGRSKSYKNYTNQIATYFNVSLDWLAGKEQKNKPATLSDELQEKLKPLYEITKDLTDEERASLVEYAELLALKHRQSDQK
jgi:transcriptional regulator with XRE-family HTH domain